MAETKYLAEQLERIRQMNEQMARVSEQLSEASDIASRDARLVRSGPLQEARDPHFQSTDEYPANRPFVDGADDAPRRTPRRRVRR